MQWECLPPCLSSLPTHPSFQPSIPPLPLSVCRRSSRIASADISQVAKIVIHSLPSPFSLAPPLFPSILRLRARLDCPTDRRRWTEERVRWILFLPAIMTFPWPSEMCPAPALWRCPPPSFSLHSYTRAAILGFTCPILCLSSFLQNLLWSRPELYQCHISPPPPPFSTVSESHRRLTGHS